MKKLIIVDASGWQYRSFYGKAEDPIAGLQYLIDMALQLHKPNEAFVAYDSGRETFRTKLYPRYKTERKETPEGYTALQGAFKQTFADSGFKPLSVPGFEADDVIGSVCARLDTYHRIILTRDKDFMQLVDNTIPSVTLCHDGNFVGEDEVLTKFGVCPHMVINVLGLQGDSTDSIPGVAGIGEKTACKLIREFGPLENLYDNLSRVPENTRKLLKVGKEMAFLCRELATIKCDVEVEL